VRCHENAAARRHDDRAVHHVGAPPTRPLGRPTEFRPERFRNTNNPNTYTSIPFGGGRRRCPGAAFSLLEARIVLRTLLRTARPAATSRRSELIGRSNVLVVPARGAMLRLDPRPSSIPSGHTRLADRR